MLSDPEKSNGLIYVSISNTGKMDGDAVVQVYVECDSHDAPPHPRLCGFTRVSVPAGETRRISVSLDKLTDTVVNDEGERIHTDHMTFHIGMSQPDEKSVRMTGIQTLTLKV